MDSALCDGFLDELRQLEKTADNSIRNLVSSFGRYGHHKRKEWAHGIAALLKATPAYPSAVKSKVHRAAAKRQIKRAMAGMKKSDVTDAAATITSSFIDELGALSKTAKEVDKRSLIEAAERGIEEDARRLAETGKGGWRRAAKRLLAFLGGGGKMRQAEIQSAKLMPWYPGSASREDIGRSMVAMNERWDPTRSWGLNFNPPPGMVGVSGIGEATGRPHVSTTTGRLGIAIHEGGHLATRAMPVLGSDMYRKAVDLSRKYGWMAGLGLLPMAALDDPEKRQQLSKAAPALALLPSLPVLFEETAANVIGGLEAGKQGNLIPFLSEALPGYGTYLARAATIPAGLFVINKLREKELAAQLKVKEGLDEKRLSDLKGGVIREAS